MIKGEPRQIHLSAEFRGLIFGAIGLALVFLVWGFLRHPDRTWSILLLNGVYFVTLSISGTFFLALQYVCGARWAEVLRRIPEAVSAFLPFGMVPMVALVFGMHTLYHWTHSEALAHDTILAGKSAYLNIPFFFFRLVLIFGIWITFSFLLRRNSATEDRVGGSKFWKRNTKLSALFLVLFAVTFSAASFDWVMSVDPHWYSTIFGLYNWSGMFLHGIVVITLIAILLKEANILRDLREDHVHDLGKLIFAFSFFWAYLWYSQFVLIWYGNIPEETIYFAERLKGDWPWLFYLNGLINFVIPFFLLLPRSVKRNPAMVKRICVLLLFGRWLDLYLMISPGVLHDKAFIGFLEVFVTLGFGAVFILVVRRALSKASLIPVNSPYLKDSLSYHQ